MRVLRASFRMLWYAFSVVVVFSAAMFGVARLLLPYAQQYVDTFASELSGQLGQTVIVDRLDTEWSGFSPRLVLRNVKVLDSADSGTALRLDRVRVGLDLVQTLMQRSPRLSELVLVGVSVDLQRQEDGSIGIRGLGLSGGEESAASAQRLIDWLLEQRRIGLESSDISWDDRITGRNFSLTDVNLGFRSHSGRHLIDLTMRMPGHLRRALTIAADFTGDPLLPESWSGRGYVAARDLDVSEILGVQPLRGVAVDAGVVNAELWVSWSGGKLLRLEGRASLEGVRWADLAGPAEASPLIHGLDALSARFAWERQREGWSLRTDQMLAVRDGKAWPASRASVHFRPGDAQPHVDVDVSFVRLQDVATGLPFVGDDLGLPRAELEQLALAGDIHDLHLSWQAGMQPDYRVSARVERASLSLASSAYPLAVEGISGRVDIGTRYGMLDIDSRLTTLELPKLFRWKLAAESLKGRLDWFRDDEGWRVRSRDLSLQNRDIQAQAILDFARPRDGGSPVIDLLARFQDANGQRVSHYLPAGIMSGATVTWLDRSIRGGSVSSGGVILRGPLREFPFREQQGRFVVAFDVRNGVLDYAPQWPGITAIDAHVIFAGSRMELTATRGRISQSRISRADVAIADMGAHPLALAINGRVVGSSQDKLDYLNASPHLREKIGRHFSAFSVSGDSVLDLDMHLDLDHDTVDAKVAGAVEFYGNGIDIPPIGEVLRSVDGRLRFTDHTVQVDDIGALLLGQPATVSVQTEAATEEAPTLITVAATGVFRPEVMASRFLPHWTDRFDGESTWDVRLLLPFGEVLPGPALLSIQSGLVGVGVRLPEPLRKDQEEFRPLDILIPLDNGKAREIAVRYGENLDAVLEVGGDYAAPSLQRAQIRLGGGAAQLPARQGVEIVGDLPYLSLDAWRTVLDAFVPDEPRVSSVRGSPSPEWLLTAVDISLGELEILGQFSRAVSMQVARVGRGWQVTLDGNELAGTISLPQSRFGDPVRADFRRLYLAPPRNSADVALDPRLLPAFQVTAEDFRYGDREFGPLLLQTTRVVDGLRVEQLVVRPHSAQFIGQGGWYVDGVMQRAQFSARVTSEDVGKTLSALGYQNAIEGGKGSGLMNVNWPGSLLDVNLDALQGSVELDMIKGRLLDLEPGGGRVFGLLSLQAMPRRLTLDFSDIFSKGFSFDRIEGKFRIENGDAYARKFFLDGPSARIDVAGRTGLAAQDYDQQVTVTPKVGESLPLLGVLGGAPQVGATLLFLQKLFQREIDKVTQIQYRIAGPWEQPVIERLRREVPDGAANGG